jgi:hypothetical protein
MQRLVDGLIQICDQFLCEARADVMAAAQYLLRRHRQLFRGALFVDIGGSASPQAANGILVLRLATQNNYRHPRVRVLHISQHVYPTAPWHADIQHQHGNLGFPQLAQHLIPISDIGKVGAGNSVSQYFS